MKLQNAKENEILKKWQAWLSAAKMIQSLARGYLEFLIRKDLTKNSQ